MSENNGDEIAALKARLAALESEAASANAQPPATPPTKMKVNGCLIAVAAIFLLLVLAVTCSRLSPPETPDKEGSEEAVATRDATATPEAPADPWRYSEQVDAMSDKVTHHACIESAAMVHLDFPYESQRPTLCIRVSPKFGKDVILQLPKGGQFICRSYSGCAVRVRFDDGAVQSFSANEPADGSSDAMFIANDTRFVAGMRAAKRVRIDAEYFQNGVQTMDFPVAGFDAEKAGWR